MGKIRNYIQVTFGALLAVVFFPGIPPWLTFSFESYNVIPPVELVGPYKPNTYLDKAEHILVGKVHGPESVIANGSVWFASNSGGEVLKIDGDDVTILAKFGEPCGNFETNCLKTYTFYQLINIELPYEESKCGRPLGLALDTIGNNLIVADAYFGLWLIDLENGDKTLLVSPQEILDGVLPRRARVFNDVAVDKKGIIYWTDSSSDYAFEDGFFAMLANPSGRLFKYCRWRNESTMLLDQINFANGVVLSPNEDFLIIAETAESQLLKYHLRGPLKGQREIFATAFPGNPDNLTPDSKGIWVPLVMARDSANPALFQQISNYPRIRRLLLRIFYMFELPFQVWNSIYPNEFCKKILYATVSFNSFIELVPVRSTVLRVDWNGNVVGVLHGYDKSIRFISHVLQVKDTLYFGSPFNHFIGKVKLPDMFLDEENEQVESGRAKTAKDEL